MYLTRVKELLTNVKFRDWQFEVQPSGLSDVTLRVVFDAYDNYNGGMSTQWGRKWLIEADDSDEQVIKTAFAAVKMATEHEVREDFMYFGKRPFSPHKRVLPRG